MPTITGIHEQKRNPRRRNVYLDGRFAFACNLNVIAKFRLRQGMTLQPQQLAEIQQGELRQECLDAALALLQLRLQSRAELVRKLTRKQFDLPLIEQVLEELTRLGYVDDARFARTRALAAAQYKHHGRRRLLLDLLKAGVPRATAEAAVEQVTGRDPGQLLSAARELARRQAPRLAKLGPAAARRRLAGMLQRRGFDYEQIRQVMEEALPATGREDAD
jgi:regulatory protein